MFDNEQESEDAIEGLNKAGLQASFARVGQVGVNYKLGILFSFPFLIHHIRNHLVLA